MDEYIGVGEKLRDLMSVVEVSEERRVPRNLLATKFLPCAAFDAVTDD